MREGSQAKTDMRRNATEMNLYSPNAHIVAKELTETRINSALILKPVNFNVSEPAVEREGTCSPWRMILIFH
jgi:hypothetical protein